ncbi:LysM peptidoglycan-binding domain-containing protein [Candidatus Saccharibacteria bacterium]|nr:LysM peptidoglycan-binding domain-containing protein [Candidatus Saccharibacteria bacterium]MBI3338372.1 LysM peptidoglycan-binding domain-containing protein [Candidatus Saccharibacteria bacterium]
MWDGAFIRIITGSLSQRLGLPKVSRRILRRAYNKSRKRIIRYGLLTANIALLIGVISFVVRNPSSGESIRQSALANDSEFAAANPLDQISSADIAVQAARLANLFEAPSVGEQADSVNAQLSFASSDEQVISKPQVVATALKSKKDIQTYTVVAGDNVGSIAAKFGVTSDSIRWSNDLNGNNVPEAKELNIPPVNGIVYVVKAGDTPDSLARKYSANKDALIAINDAEVSGLIVGDKIVIPDGTIATTRVASNYLVGFSFGSSAIYGHNAYAYGFCTWYVASKIAVPSNWGNANTWDNVARISGWTVSTAPVQGAILQTDAGYAGHVGVVEAVSPDGSQIKYSDMNGLAGWGRVGYSDWVPVSRFPRYIYR